MLLSKYAHLCSSPTCLYSNTIKALLSFSTTSATQIPALKPHVISEFLISSIAFCPDKASRASKRLSHLKSLQNPQSFIDFMRSQGFEGTHLRKILACDPRWLCCNVEKTLKPKFRSLQDIGFSGSNLVLLIQSNPCVLDLSIDQTVSPRIQFWRSILGSGDYLTRLFKRKTYLIGYSLEKTALPNLALLQDCGVPDTRTVLLLRKNPRFILQSPSKFAAQ